MSTWLHSAHFKTGRCKWECNRRKFQDDSDLLFFTIIQFIGVIHTKPATPLYYDYFSQEEKSIIKKKEKKKNRIRREFTDIYSSINKIADLEDISPYEKRELLREIRQDEAKEIASVDEYDDYWDDDLRDVNIDRKHLDRLRSHGFDF